MKRRERYTRLSIFDREPFLATILRSGTLLCIGLIGLGLAWRWTLTSRLGFEDTLEGTNVLAFLWADVRHVAVTVTWWPHALLHLGVATLFVIPYARTLASCWYFAFVEHDARYALLTGYVAVVMTYILLFG